VKTRRLRGVGTGKERMGRAGKARANSLENLGRGKDGGSVVTDSAGEKDIIGGGKEWGYLGVKSKSKQEWEIADLVQGIKRG